MTYSIKPFSVIDKNLRLCGGMLFTQLDATKVIPVCQDAFYSRRLYNDYIMLCRKGGSTTNTSPQSYGMNKIEDYGLQATNTLIYFSKVLTFLIKLPNSTRSNGPIQLNLTPRRRNGSVAGVIPGTGTSETVSKPIVLF
jgi:hypothetical protein